MVIFYVLAPIPTLITRRFSDSLQTSSALKEACAFFTTGIVLSAFALPIVLARAPSAAPTVSFGTSNSDQLMSAGVFYCGNSLVL